jgi:hypothetical protein
MIRTASLLLLIGVAFAGGAGSRTLHAQHALSPEHERIDFLVGSWRTASESPDGRIRHGTLSYRWVLGGAWMRIEFVGEAGAGDVWEAHGMQRWNAGAGEYEAWIFAADGPPVRYRGMTPAPGTFRVELTTPDGITSGIDYRRTDGGAVFQENWVVRDGVRHVTLRTNYTRLSFHLPRVNSHTVNTPTDAP